jgi:hypothetical protein
MVSSTFFLHGWGEEGQGRGYKQMVSIKDAGEYHTHVLVLCFGFLFHKPPVFIIQK